MALAINPDYYPQNTNASQSMAGKNLLLYIAYGEGATVESPIWNLVGGQRNSPLSMSADEIDASDKSSGGWGETLQGTKTWSIEQECVYKVNDNGFDIMRYAFLNDIPVYLMRRDKNGNAVKGFANITEFSDDNPHDDVATATVTFSGIGAPEFSTNEPDPGAADGAIDDLAATAGTGGQANLTFSKITGAAAIVLQTSTNGIDFADDDTVISNGATTATVTGLDTGVTYFRLKVNGGAQNGYSNVAVCTVTA